MDSTDAGQYQAQPYMTLESGVLPESVFSGIASAIRGQNGESTLYQPGDMAAAILALEWDVGYKIRTLLLDDGTLEINYYERNHGLAVLLLVLHVARWRQRHRMGQQQDCVHVLPHRHGEHAGVHHDSVR